MYGLSDFNNLEHAVPSKHGVKAKNRSSVDSMSTPSVKSSNMCNIHLTIFDKFNHPYILNIPLSQDLTTIVKFNLQGKLNNINLTILIDLTIHILNIQ